MMEMKRLELKVELNKKSANLSKRSKFKDKFPILPFNVTDKLDIT